MGKPRHGRGHSRKVGESSQKTIDMISTALRQNNVPVPALEILFVQFRSYNTAGSSFVVNKQYEIQAFGRAYTTGLVVCLDFPWFEGF